MKVMMLYFVLLSLFDAIDLGVVLPFSLIFRFY